MVLGLFVPDALSRGTWEWSDGSTASLLQLDSVTTSGEYTVNYKYSQEVTTCTFHIYVSEGKSVYRTIEDGNYLIRHRYTDTYLTSPNEKEASATLASLMVGNSVKEVDLSQVWYLEQQNGRYSFINLKDSLHLNKEGVMKSRTTRSFRFKGAVETNYLSIQNTSTSGNVCWTVTEDGTVNYAGAETPIDYPFELIPYHSGVQGVDALNATRVATVQYYTLEGKQLSEPRKGILICRTIHMNGTAEVKKVFYK